MWKQWTKDEFVDEIKDIITGKKQLEEDKYMIVDMKECVMEDLSDTRLLDLIDYINDSYDRVYLVKE